MMRGSMKDGGPLERPPVFEPCAIRLSAVAEIPALVSSTRPAADSPPLDAEDLYSLSAVAYFALLGRAPFSGKTPEQILAKQTTDDVPPLVAERRDVPREVEDVLRRALRSEPAERFHSASAFHAAVRGAFGGFLRRLAALFRPES